MIDELNPDSGSERETTKQPEVGRTRPLADREVPLGQQADRTLAASVHAWLDGDLPEAAVRKSESPKDVEFWRGLDAEMARVRRLRTPSHVEAQIMAALPSHAPSGQITPWFRREFVVTPGTALLAAVGLVAVASIVTALFFR